MELALRLNFRPMKNITLLFIALLSTQLMAADTLNYQHAEIPFTEKRLAVKTTREGVEIISSAQIVAMPVKSLADVLNYISGIDMNQRGVNGVQADVSLDGANFEETLLLIDGIPMRDPQTGHHMMNLPISLQQIDHIEVIHGAAGRLYGSNALAGAINIVTRSLEQAPKAYLELTSGIQAAQNNNVDPMYQYNQIQSAFVFGRDQFKQSISLQAQTSNGYRYNTDARQLQLSYRNQFTSAKNNSWKTQFSMLKNSFGANGFYAFPYDVDAGEHVNTYLGAIQGIINVKKWQLKPSIYSRYNEDHYVFIRSVPAIYENRHFTSSNGANLDMSRTNALGRIAVGAEARLETIHSNNLGVHQRYYTNAFLEQFWQYAKYGTLTAGLNAQYNAVLGWSFFPGIDWKQKVVAKVYAFASAGMGNRLPTFTELYYTDRANTSNDSLKAETARYFSIGFKQRGQLSFEAYAFYRSIDQFVSYARMNATDKWTPNNIAQVNMKGINLNGSYQWCKYSSIQFAYTYLNPSFNTTDAAQYKYSYEHAKHRVVLALQQNLSSRFSQTISYRYVERFQANHYQVVDYRLNAQINPRVRAYCDITNVFNAQYYDRISIPMPSRWLRIGLCASL